MGTELVGPVMAYAFAAAFWSGNLTGEIRAVNDFKRALYVFVGADIFSMASCAILMYLVIQMVGNEFFTSANFIWMTGRATSMPVAPFYGLFIITATRNPAWWFWILIGFHAWFWMWPTNNYVGSTRYMFAMSFDRLLPSFLSTVKTRFATPFYALIVFFIGSVIFAYLYFYTPFAGYTLGMPLFMVILFLGVCSAGVVFPYNKRTREMYEASPMAKYKAGSVHLITVAGILGFLYSLYMVVLYMVDANYGVNAFWSLAFVTGGLVAGAVIYAGLKLYRKSRGVQIDKLYGTIPVE